MQDTPPLSPRTRGKKGGRTQEGKGRGLHRGGQVWLHRGGREVACQRPLRFRYEVIFSCNTQRGVYLVK